MDACGDMCDSLPKVVQQPNDWFRFLAHFFSTFLWVTSLTKVSAADYGGRTRKYCECIKPSMHSARGLALCVRHDMIETKDGKRPEEC